MKNLEWRKDPEIHAELIHFVHFSSNSIQNIVMTMAYYDISNRKRGKKNLGTF